MKNTVQSKKQRDSSIELLRIIAMLMIVISHYSCFSGIDFSNLLTSNFHNAYLLQIVVLGKLGVDVFVLITGYFLISKPFNIAKLFKLEAQVWLYSVSIFLIIALEGDAFSIIEFVKSVFPAIFHQYRFYTCYVALFILSPFINLAISYFSRKSYLSLILIMLTIWVVLPTFTTESLYGESLAQFVMLYLIGGYIRLYPDNKMNTKKYGIVVTITGFTLLFLSVLTLDFLGEINIFFSSHALWFFNENSLLVVVSSIGLLITFININLPYNKFVNEVATCTFGVYLIHTHPNTKEWIWRGVFHVDKWATSPWLPLHMIGAVVITFIVCTIIEMGRRKFIEPLYIDKLNTFADKMERKAIQIVDKIIEQ